MFCDLGANMGPTWHPTWHQVGAQIAQKSIPKTTKKLKPLEIDFWEDFGGFGEAKWSQVGTKMGSKMELISITAKIKKTYKHQWILMIFEAPGVPKSMKNRSKICTKIDQKIEASWDPFLGGFWRIWGGIMEPSWYQNGIQNKSYLENAENHKNV